MDRVEQVAQTSDLAKELIFTDFPLPEITLYFTNNTIYLPSEH